MISFFMLAYPQLWEKPRKNEEFRRAAGKKASTVGERLRTIEGHAKLNSALLALMLQCLTPEQADKYNDLKKKYIE